MPYIRVNCPKGALTPEQKARLAPRIVHALIRQEIDPVTDIGTAATGFFFNELEVDNCFPGGVPLTQHSTVLVTSYAFLRDVIQAFTYNPSNWPNILRVARLPKRGATC